MKTQDKMKNLLLLCVIALTAMACPNDDDNPVTDQLVDTWKYSMYLENGVEQELEPCDTEETIIVNADGTFSVEFFTEVNGECISDDGDSGTWSNAGNGNYTFVFNGENESEQITFEGNTLYTEFVYDNETPDDTSDDIVERDIYVRQ